MNIVIKRNIIQELDNFKTKVDLLSRGLSVGIVSFLLGVTTIVVCRNDFGVTENSEFCYLVLEMIFFFLSFIIFRRIYASKKAYKVFYNTAIIEYKGVETYSTTTIDEYFFIYESLRKYQKFSWTAFNQYRFADGNLILMQDDSYNTSFIIKYAELPTYEFEILFNFVRGRLRMKK